MLGIIPFFLIFLLLQSFFRFVDPFVMTGSFILGVFVYKILGWEVSILPLVSKGRNSQGFSILSPFLSLYVFLFGLIISSPPFLQGF